MAGRPGGSDGSASGAVGGSGSSDSNGDGSSSGSGGGSNSGRDSNGRDSNGRDSNGSARDVTVGSGDSRVSASGSGSGSGSGAGVRVVGVDFKAVTGGADAVPTRKDVDSWFAPFVRVSPPVDTAEVAKTAVAAVLLLPVRVAYLAVAGGLVWLLALLALAGQKDKQYYLHRALPGWRKALLACMYPLIRSILFVTFAVYTIKTRRYGFDDDEEQGSSKPGMKYPEAYVVVANHLGYLDIVVLLAKYRGSFVAKGAIEEVAFVGTVAQALQCMFVRDGEPLTTQLVSRVRTTYACHADQAEKCSGCGSCMNKIIIFPEGTTNNGGAMIPFRTGVFNASEPVRPVCIEFPYKRFNLSWETIPFREHLFRTLTQFRNCVEVTEMPTYAPSAAEVGDARLYASNVQARMAAAIAKPVVALNRKHKFLYHSYLLGKEPDARVIAAKARALSDEDTQLRYVTDGARRGADAV